MTIQVQGVLKDPLNQLSKGILVRVTAVASKGATLQTSPAKLYTDKDTAAYDFELVDGTHTIEVVYGNQYNLVGTVTVDENSQSPVSLIELIG